jgi:hypothetical protein
MAGPPLAAQARTASTPGEGAGLRNDIGRGILIVFVFYVHSLHALVGGAADPAMMPAAWLQLKILAPQVALFFLLAGMSSHRLHAKSLRSVLVRSLMLLFMAVLSHLIGAVLELLLYPSLHPWSGALRAVAGPILLGTGYATFVAWFFIVLATTRLLAWCFMRAPAWFWAAAAAIGAAGLAAGHLGLGDNLFEWRNLPVSVTLFLVGTRLSGDRPVRDVVALSGLLVACAIGLLVTPALLSRGPCLRCDLTFVAQPMIGAYGFLPAYLAQVAGGAAVLLWSAQRLQGTATGRVARFFGRSSLRFLLLHGWVITAIYPAAIILLLPSQENLLVFPAIMALNLAVHALLFILLRPALGSVVTACNRAAGRIVEALAKRR